MDFAATFTLPEQLTVRVSRKGRDCWGWWSVDELCLACGGEITWTARDEAGRSLLHCAPCGTVLTDLTRGVSLERTKLEEDGLHEDDWALVQERMMARLGELGHNPLAAQVLAAEFMLLFEGYLFTAPTAPEPLADGSFIVSLWG